MIQGVLAAAVTPLSGRGSQLDEGAFGGLVDTLVGAGVDGVLAGGTAGEGILLAPAERERAVELFLAATGGRAQVLAHCGAQTTSDTVRLAAHAAEVGAHGVAVIAPPYFPLGEPELLAHFVAAARACSPLAFYVYEFERASGYAVPIPVLLALREQASNFAGMKVSDAPWEKFERYLVDGLDIFVGPESLIHRGLAAGAVGAVSALATVLPELVVAAVREGGADASRRLGELRLTMDRFPRHAALKHVLVRRGVAISEDVRAPLRALTGAEAAELDAVIATVGRERA